MSLIDDALKRAQAAQGNRPPENGKRPWTPAPLPDRGRADRRRALRVAVAVLILVTAGAGGW